MADTHPTVRSGEKEAVQDKNMHGDDTQQAKIQTSEKNNSKEKTTYQRLQHFEQTVVHREASHSGQSDGQGGGGIAASAPTNTSSALVPAAGVLAVNPSERTSAAVISEKYSYHVQHNGCPGTIATSQQLVGSAGREPNRDTIKQIPKYIQGSKHQMKVGDIPPFQGPEMSKSVPSAGILYDSTRNSFERQTPRVISSMDVLYTAATASGLGSAMPNIVPGMDMLYKRSREMMQARSVSTSSVPNNTAEVVMGDMLPSHQSVSIPKTVVTSAAEYGVSETSVHRKIDNNVYEKYKNVTASVSSGLEPSTSRNIPNSENHSSVSSSNYYIPQTSLCSEGSTVTVRRDGKQMTDMGPPNLHMGYYNTTHAGGVSGEHQQHPEGTAHNTSKDYNRISESLSGMNMISFMAAYDGYRKVGISENQTQAFSEYHRVDDGNSQSQKIVSASEMGPEPFSYNMQHEKVSSSNMMHIPEVHSGFSYYENGQMGLSHQLQGFTQRESSQNSFYPKLLNHDHSVMYARHEVPKGQTQMYQDLLQGNPIAYFHSSGKANLPSIFPPGLAFGFQQGNQLSVAPCPPQVSNKKDNFSVSDEAVVSNSATDVQTSTSSVVDVSGDVGEGNVVNDSIATSKSERQMNVSESATVYSVSSHTLQSDQHIDTFSIDQQQPEQLNSSSEPYFQPSCYADYSLQTPPKDLNSHNSNSKSDMSDIKMKISAILESKSLQFDDIPQQKSQSETDLNKGGSSCNSDSNMLPFTAVAVVDNVQPENEGADTVMLKQIETVSSESAVSGVSNEGFKVTPDKLVTQSTGPSKNVNKTNKKSISAQQGAENSRKNKTKKVKHSEDVSLKSAKESAVSNKENNVAIISCEKKATNNTSHTNDDNVLKENLKVPQYKCDICQKEFSHLCSFQRHVRFHSGKPLFACDICGQGFDDLFAFVDHITEVESDKLKQLKTVPELFESKIIPQSVAKSEVTKCKKRLRKRLFRRSKRLKKSNSSTVVKESGKKEECEKVTGDGDSSADENEDVAETEDDDDVKVENDGDVRTKNFKCNECGMQFNYARYLSAHLLTHSDQKSFQCEICSKEFSHGHSLNRHRKKVHPKAAIHACNICGEGFSRFSDLKEHSKCHLADSSLKCKMCDQDFSCQRDLQLHVSSHTGGKAFQCDLCWKQFTQYCTLLRHKRRFDHSGGPPYKCKWCGEGFYEMGKLLSHSRKHMGSGPHKCDVCGKGFATTNNLKVHKSSVHSSEKPFCCDLCGDQFTRVSYLRQHIKTHTGDRPYVCELCGKGFGMQDTLSKHMRTHTGEKPYSCDHCGKQFSLTATLTVHKRTHTGERPYVCEVCGKGFIDNSSWNKHIKHHHKSTGERAINQTVNSANETRENNANNYKTFCETGAAVTGTFYA